MNTHFVPDPSCNVPINADLKCGEEWTGACDSLNDNDDDDDVHQGSINFNITLPGVQNVTLTFNCRDKSSGVLLPTEPSVAAEVLEDGPSDPFFFEQGFYLEAKTGFQPWPGSRLMVEAFTCMKNSSRMDYWQSRLANKDLKILEVGAGIGVVGTCLAAAGGRILVTDLPVLVDHGIWPNLKRNGNVDTLDSRECSYIGAGCAEAIALDWFKPVSSQLSRKTCASIDVIIACDCMFLRKLIDPLFTAISALFESSLKSPTFLFTFQRRNMAGVFTDLEELLELINQKGWKVECLAWRTIAVEGDGDQDLHLFEVTPGKQTVVKNEVLCLFSQEEKKEQK